MLERSAIDVAARVAAPLAMILLLAYVAAVAVVVRQWALPRDLP